MLVVAICSVSDATEDVAFKVKSFISIPPQWTQIRRAYPDELVPVQIALRQTGYDNLTQQLLEVSNPRHERYGQHLSAADVESIVKTPEDTLNSVMDWLQGSTLYNVSQSEASDWLFLSLPVHVLESLVDAEYFQFRNSHGYTVLRTLQWSLPVHVYDHIDLIQPTNNFLLAQPQSRYGGFSPPAWETEHRRPTHAELVEEDVIQRHHITAPTAEEVPPNPTVEQACNRLAISPLCLSVIYGTYGYRQQKTDQNSIAMVNFLGESSNRSDIQLFLERSRPDAADAGAAYSFKTEVVASGEDQQTRLCPEQLASRQGFEGALDAQTILGLTWPLSMTTYNVGSKPPFLPRQNHTENRNEPYLVWLEYLLAQKELPRVISISYADDEKSVPPEYARRVCAKFAELGARGVSVLVASGDFGVGRNDLCMSNDGEHRRFAPSFPASCPFVTSVGATRLVGPEIVAFDGRSDFASGGGFSDLFARPDYQFHAVESYLSGLGEDYDGLYNPMGRGIPDISALGYHFPVVWDGAAHLQDGTSASTPTVASIIALLNDALLADGRPPLGFLNPWIYSEAASGFKDVTWGSNFGCNVSGFNATEGWDPATGIGTPVRNAGLGSGTFRDLLTQG
ncbi:Peptidase S8/S53, subtilisin/kexin/sedolisin [Penicillium italicum]|uniref:tripeptidyl-peptidase II n=1 Tax=Penicillium italicum TaxID=40296 RepID=A0A0A2KS28_PENIT|nr:Peptidase S8/S53, subtilisin/kexin/sedolisin [Penicillium italicum]